MREIWKDVIGFEGYYQVSDNGMVRSLDRIINTKIGLRHPVKGRVLSPTGNGNGYLVAYFRKDNKRFNRYVHRLVAEAYIPKVDGLDQINHKDGNKQNNNVSNLEWTNPKLNNKYAYDIGLCDINIGENSCHSLYKDLDIIKMFELYATGNYTYPEIANIFKTSSDYVYGVLNRKKRKHTIIDIKLIDRVRIVQIKKKGSNYHKNKWWYEGFLCRLKAIDENLWRSERDKIPK